MKPKLTIQNPSVATGGATGLMQPGLRIIQYAA